MENKINLVHVRCMFQFLFRWDMLFSVCFPLMQKKYFAHFPFPEETWSDSQLKHGTCLDRAEEWNRKKKKSTISFGIYFPIKCRRLSIAAGKEEKAKRETIRWKTFSQRNFTLNMHILVYWHAEPSIYSRFCARCTRLHGVCRHCRPQVKRD